MIFENSEALNRYREPISFFDKKLLCTYYVCKTEPQIYFVAIYDKKKDGDVTIKEFTQNICNFLRNFKLYEQLKSLCFRVD